MNWLPRFTINGWTGIESDDRVFEGMSVQLIWLRWTVQIAFALEDVAKL